MPAYFKQGKTRMQLRLLTFLLLGVLVRAQQPVYPPATGISLQPYTVGSGGVSAYTLIEFDGNGNVIGATNDYQGIAMATVASGGLVQVAAESGSVWQCIFENAAIQGDIAIPGTTNKNYCHDSGQTSQSFASIAAGTKIIGTIQTSAAAGGMASVRLAGLGVQAGGSSSGTSFPAACVVGQQFVRTDLSAGANFYICDAANTFHLVGATTAGTGPFSLTGQTSSSIPATPQSSNTTLFFPASGGPAGEDASGNVYAMPSATILNAPANGFWAGPTSGSNASPTYRAITYSDFPALTSGHLLVGNSSVATDTALSGDCTLASSGAISCSNILDSKIGPAIASAATIAPTTPIVHITGTTTITTITPPSRCGSSGVGCLVRLIPDGLWSTGTTGNIAIASTAVVSRVLMMVYDPTTGKWYPNY